MERSEGGSMRWARRRHVAALLLPLWLAACGGGGDDGDGPPPPSAGCSVAEQKAWLTSYFDDWYFWYRLSPRPDPAAYAAVDDYFAALLYTGGDAAFPADRWSRSESTESYNRFYGDGATLGYGLAVNGVEVARDTTRPLYVRLVEAQSPAAAAGVRRGDQVISINGRPVATVIAADDYSALNPGAAGDTLTLVLRREGADRTVVLTAAIFTLTPVSGAAVLTAAGGRRVGYVIVKDMISQALGPLEAAFSSFKAAGVSDVVIDVRYNGGGLVSTGATVASYVTGARAGGQTYATLLYNDKRAAANNQTFTFSTPTSALGLTRAYVLTGPRTCSATEQVINGLRGAGVAVVSVGGGTCGKPVGFLPASNCGRTYSIVNFESVNRSNEGRYFDGFNATCAVAENFTVAQGAAGDPLLAAAQYHAENGVCPAQAGGVAQVLSAGRKAVRDGASDERSGMVGR